QFLNVEEIFNKAKQERMEFLNKWIFNLPESHKLGLVMIESSQFSERFQSFMKATKEVTSNTEGVSYDFVKEMQDLGTKFSKQEITMQEYQQKIYELQLKNSMKSIKKEYHPYIIKAINENRYPGVTDNSMYVTQFLTYIMQFSKWYDVEETMDLAAEYQKKIMDLSMKQDPESKAELDIWSRIIALQQPDENLWKPALEEMRQCKEQLLKNEIDRDKFVEDIGKIQNKWIFKQMGRDVDVNVLFDKQIQITAKSANKESFEEQSEALSLTTMIMASYLFSAIPNSDEYQELMKVIYSDEEQEENKKELIKKVFAVYFERFDPIVKKSEEFTGITKSLTNISILSAMVNTFQYSGNEQQSLEYRNKWDKGEYPGYTCEKDIYKYILDWVNSWKEKALEELPARFIQKLCGSLIMLAGMGNNFELCKFVTETSLKISEGKITEATPQGIPSALAAFYEEQGNLEEALKYYNMSLDVIKLINAPIWADVIIYRAALVHFKLGYKEKALEILGRYHPDFYGNEAVIAMPARKIARQLAEGLANELGYSSAKEGVDNILK
ncbi:MAG: tetratricopeptide repeat protein, partial [Candidatus Lokiarchaeota archaeon]|nr:tetratricopeptide repeat protein [Candidatus Lokiarchaeota archaeon]